MKRNISLQQLINELDYTARQCENVQPLLNEISMQLEYTTQESFEREQDGFGNKWTPLSKQTLKHKRGNKILTESSLLQSFINARTKLQKSKEGTQGIVSIGTNLEYARIHQFGGKAGKGLRVSIPARPFLPMNDKGEIPKGLKEDIKAIVLRHLNIKG